MTSPATAEPEHARTMARLLWRFEIMRRAEEQAEELRSAEGRLLWLLTGSGKPLTLKQIAAELELEQSTANRQVNSALRAQLVRRFRANGTQAWLFEPTESGVSLYERSLSCHLARVDDALSAVPAAERASFVASFAAFIEAYGQHAS